MATPAQARRRPILIVEHSQPVRANIAKRLRAANFPVHECVNVEDAMHAMTKHGVPRAFVLADSIGKDSDAGSRFARAISTVAALRERPAIVLVNGRTVRTVSRGLPDYVPAVPVDAEMQELVQALGSAERCPERAANTVAQDPLWDELQRTVSTMDQALELCRGVAERVRRNELPGPLVPELLGKVRQLCTQPALQPRTLTTFIERHQGLSVRFLTMANSAYYSRGTKIKSVRQAVARIGAEPCLTLMQAIAAQEYVVGSDRRLRAAITRGLEEAYVVSAVAKTVAAIFGDADEDEAGLVGLFHNIGRTFLLYTLGLLLEKDEAGPLDLASVETITASRAYDLNRIVVDAMLLPNEVNLVFARSSTRVTPTVLAVRRAIWIADFCFAGENRCPFDGPAKLLGFDANALQEINRRMPTFAALLREYRR